LARAAPLATIPRMAVTESTTISHYRLLELLGKGAMGEVWLAEDTQLPRQVAVKLLPRHLAGDPEAVERLQREAQAAASVDHPAVVTVYEAGIADGRPYIVMQKVEGETLEQRLARGPMDTDEALRLALDIADALAEVHALGIVHRDLKPANIIMSARGPRILDFGIASVKGSPRMTATGIAVGTPLAMSPEQIRGFPADHRSDLWSLGVILYQALTGRRPFDGETFEAVTYRVLNENPPAPGTLREGISPDLDYAVSKLLRKDPDHRYSRAEDMMADLKCCLMEAPGAGTPPAQAGPVKPAPPRVAVLYFDVMSANPDDRYLADGLVEDLIVDLTRVQNVHVATRAEVQPYRDRNLPPRTLARELGVDFVLLGGVRRAGNRARISVQLVRAGDGHTLWAERFDRTLEDLFDMQAEVSKRIVDALQVALKPEERAMLDRSPTTSHEAYTYYLRAVDLLDKGRDDNRRAEALLKEALTLDPDFALAHAMLGQCYALRGMRWWGAPREVAELAMPHAQRALELDPDLPEAHVVCSMVERLRGNTEGLIESLGRIVERNPNDFNAREWVGWSYMVLGRNDEAEAVLEKLASERPDKFVPVSYLATVYESTGREDLARAAYARAMEVEVEHLRKHPDDALARAYVAISLIREGKIDQGVAQAEMASALAPDDGRNRYNVACAFARAGLKERAMRELRAALELVQDYISDWPRRDPDLAILHDDPEFIRLFGTAGPTLRERPR
jgi:non-specific serine/threonine protein kinase